MDASRGGRSSPAGSQQLMMDVPLLGTRVTSESTDATDSDVRGRSSLAEKISLSISNCCARDGLEGAMISPLRDINDCHRDRDFDASLLPFTDAEAIFYSVAVGLFCGFFTAAFIAVLKVRPRVLA